MPVCCEYLFESVHIPWKTPGGNENVVCDGNVFDHFTETSSLFSRVSDQNGVSPLYIMLEIHHSGWEPSFYS